MVERLEGHGGAHLLTLNPSGGAGIASKARIVRQLVSPRLFTLRGKWNSGDVVLVIGWYALPLLLLIRVGFVTRPRRLISMATFVHSPSVRRVVNTLFGLLTIRELEFIVFSEEELRSLIEDVGVPRKRVHKVIYRGRLEPEVEPEAAGAPYVFTGGYSNRDYDTFFAAVGALPTRVVAVASSQNRVTEPPPPVELYTDVPWPEFEQLLANCEVLVLPLRASGEASGQNVLMRGMRYLRPVVATHHTALIDYLGSDYAGFVPPEDAGALRFAIERVLSDESFRNTLVEQIADRRRLLLDRGEMADEILEIVSR